MPGNLFIACAVAALLFAHPVSAATPQPNRSEYVEAVEPICKAETEAHAGVLAGVQEMVQRGELKRAAPRVLEAGRALGEAVRRLAVVPRPPGDAERLSRWFGFARTGGGLLREMGKALRAGNRGLAQRLARRLLRETKRANATVAGFEFDHCRLDPARFG